MSSPLTTSITDIDAASFFATLSDTASNRNLALSSSSSSSDDDAEMASSRLLGKADNATPKSRLSRWFQLADVDDSENVIERFDRLGIVSRLPGRIAQDLQTEEDLENAAKKAGDKEKDTERRMRQRSQFFETYSEDEDASRLVVSHKKRRLDELNATIKKVDKLKAEKDWVSITEELKELDNKVIKKMLKMKQDFQRPPKRYIKFMVDLRDEVVELNKDRAYMKDLIPSQKKSLSKLQGPLRNAPYLKQFQDMADEYSANKDNYNVEEDFGLEEEEEALKRAKERQQQEDERNESRADSGPSKWLASDSDSDESDSSDEDQEEFQGNSKWLAGSDDESTSDEDADEDRAGKKDKASKQRGQGYKKKRRGKTDEETQEEFQLDDGQIEDKVSELRITRGKRLLTVQEIIDQLKLYYRHAESDEVMIQVLTELLSTIIDKYASVDVYMSVDEFAECYNYFSTVLAVVEDHPELKFVEVRANEDIKKQKGIVHITGNLCTIMEQLDTQYVKALKYTDAHTQDYIVRLQQMYMILNVAERTYLYYERINRAHELGRIAYRLYFHHYYRRLSDHSALLASQRAQIPEDNQAAREVVTNDLTATLTHLARLIYNTMTADIINKTVLMQIYHLTMKDQYAEARDLLMMSNVSDLISQANSSLTKHNRTPAAGAVDPDLQVLFNRVVSQLGLCAFRNGQIRETYNTLRDLITAPTQLREALAQIVRYSKENQEVEKRERERFVPYHMHINTELIEAAYVTCAILIEVPYTKHMSLDTRKRFQSIALRKYFRFVEDRIYAAPPENTREHLYAASTFLAEGKWQECYHELSVLTTWDLCENKAEILEMIKRNVKVEALRAYLFSFLKFYESIGLDSLSAQFEMDFATVQGIIAKMIYNQELYGYLDEPSRTVNAAAKDEPNELHRLANHLIYRAVGVESHNEQLADFGFSQEGSANLMQSTKQYHVDQFSELRKKYAY